MKKIKTPIRKRKNAVTLTQMKDVMEDMFNDLKGGINGVKSEVNGLRGEINGVKSEVNGLRSELKDGIIKIDDKISDLYAMMQQDFAKKEDLEKLDVRVEILETA